MMPTHNIYKQRENNCRRWQERRLIQWKLLVIHRRHLRPVYLQEWGNRSSSTLDLVSNPHRPPRTSLISREKAHGLQPGSNKHVASQHSSHPMTYRRMPPRVRWCNLPLIPPEDLLDKSPNTVDPTVATKQA
jgi:hypothetical protein